MELIVYAGTLEFNDIFYVCVYLISTIHYFVIFAIRSKDSKIRKYFLNINNPNPNQYFKFGSSSVYLSVHVKTTDPFQIKFDTQLVQGLKKQKLLLSKTCF